MAKLTLLEIVQDILSDTDSDEVNSIDDTVESEQAAQIVKSTYFALTSNREWAQHKEFTQLEPLADMDKPTYVKVGDNVKRLIFVNYDCSRQEQDYSVYKEIAYKEPDDFLRYTNVRKSNKSNVKVVTDPSGVSLLILNDKSPQYYTSFDDENLVFDSWDSEVDSTIQGSKIQAMAYITPSWSHQDDFIPDLPEEGFIALQEEAKSKFAIRIRQMADEKAEQESRRQQTWLSRNNWKVSGGIKYPDYGRKR